MLRRVLVDNLQQITVEDFNNFGLFPQQTFDATIGDLGPAAAFAGFNVVQSGTAEITVAAGRLYSSDGRVFYNTTEGGEVIDLLPHLPVVTRKYVAIAAWGTEVETETEPRSFLTDAVTRTTVARVTATESRRHANLGAVPGLESPDPPIPAVAANYLAIAYVLLDPTGIISITMVEANRTQSIRLHTARLNEMDAWRARTGTQIDTMRTDIAALAAQIGGLAPLDFALRIAVDVARVKEVLNLPSAYTSWGADHFLTLDDSDAPDPANNYSGHPDWLCRVDEGIRPANAAERDAQFGLFNPLDPLVRTQANFVLPEYNQISRLEVLGFDSELSISQFPHQTITWELMAKTRTRIRWGTAFYVCSNGVWWFAPSGADWTTSVTSRGEGWNTATGGGIGGNTPNTDLIYDPTRNILTRPANPALNRPEETFQILDVQDNPNHTILRLAQFWVDEIVDSYYWRQVVTNEGLNGSVISQTFLNSQGGWLTSVDIFFSRISAAGAVHCLICETDPSGSPLFNRVIGRSTLEPEWLRKYPAFTRFEFIPTYLAKGQRYAIVLQTPGNHFVCLVHGNKFAQGSLFQSTDGTWSMGDLQKDMTFRLNFAQFINTRVAVQLISLELQNGIAAIDLNYDSLRPPGTSVEFEIQHQGYWKPLGYYASNPLTALPALLPLRAVLTGTTDEMPGFGVGVASRALTSRPRDDFKHVSTARTMPAPVKTVFIELRLEAWRGVTGGHSCTCQLLYGALYGTAANPAITTDTVDPNDPTCLIRKLTFTFATPISAYKIRIIGQTGNVIAWYHVAERVDVALAT
jgi:hypothetical protein